MNVETNYWSNEAFSLNIEEKKTSQSLESLLASYLGEYRFELHLYQYEYLFSETEGLIDPKTKEPMLLKAQRAIERRIKEGKSIQREEAELNGFYQISKLLTANQQIRAGFVWVSPPGEKSDGYGDYGFIFYGVIDGYQNGNWHISMNARRVEDGRSLEKFNQVLTHLTGQEVSFLSDVDFLNNPMLLSPQITDTEEIISNIFNPINEQTQQIFEQALGNNGFLKPLITMAVEAYLKGNYNEFQRLLTALENLAEELKNSIQSIYLLNEDNPAIYTLNPAIIDFYSSYAPPPVSGSCGSTDNEKKDPFNLMSSSSNILEKYKLLSNKDEYGSLTFECPHCGEIHQREPHQLLTHCPKTGKEITKC